MINIEVIEPNSGILYIYIYIYIYIILYIYLRIYTLYGIQLNEYYACKANKIALIAMYLIYNIL